MLLSRLFFLVFCVMLTCSSGYAEPEIERAAIKTRLLENQERRQLFMLQEKEDTSAPSTATAASLQRGLLDSISFSSYIDAYAVYPISVHQVAGIGAYGQTIALEDGSTFAVSSSHQYQVNYWPIGSLIYVLPNHGYFFGLVRSTYDLCLYNATTNETIEVDLILGPYLYGDLSEWIINIDNLTGWIWLRDGHIVEVHPNDRYLLWNWEPQEHVIVGTNDGSGYDAYPNIIVNVASVTYVRVRFL